MRCKHCLTEKLPADFYASNKARCKACVCQSVTKHRQANLERVRSYDRVRGSQPHRVAARAEYRKTAAYAESHGAAAKRWEAQHPERKRAIDALNNAVRDGKVARWPCEVCGDKAHAHHPHYDAPLMVTWLCPIHHKQAHALIAEAA
jgi:hypothetical protein